MNTFALVPPTQRSPREAGDAHLKFQLSPHVSAMLSMQHVQEVPLLAAHRITPMPNLPSCVLGLTNRRSRVLWVVNLAQLLGIAHHQPHIQQYSLIIVQVGAVPLGLVVHQVEGMTWFSADIIESPIGQVSASLVPYLRGYVLQNQEHEQEAALVLDAEAIAQSPILCSNLS